MKLCRRLATDHPRISDNAPEVFIRDEIIPNGVIGTNIPKTECLFLSTRRCTPLLWAMVERGQGRQRPQEGEGASAVPFTASALFCTTPTFLVASWTSSVADVLILCFGCFISDWFTVKMVRSFAQWTKTLSFPSRLSPQKQATPSILPDKQATPISITPDVSRVVVFFL